MPATAKKPSSKVTTKPAAAKSAAKPNGPAHPSWIDMIKECIVAHPEEARAGVSRHIIKKFVETKYNIESTATSHAYLNRAIASGAVKGLFRLPKGPAGKVKLAVTKSSKDAAKENTKPPAKKLASAKIKPTTAKKPAAPKAASAKPKAASAVKKPAAAFATKKAAAPKPKAASGSTATKSSTVKKVALTKKVASAKKPAVKKPSSVKKPSAKKAVIGETKKPASKAKASTTKAKGAATATTKTKPASAKAKPGPKPKAKPASTTKAKPAKPASKPKTASKPKSA